MSIQFSYAWTIFVLIEEEKRKVLFVHELIEY